MHYISNYNPIAHVKEGRKLHPIYVTQHLGFGVSGNLVLAQFWPSEGGTFRELAKIRPCKSENSCRLQGALSTLKNI